MLGYDFVHKKSLILNVFGKEVEDFHTLIANINFAKITYCVCHNTVHSLEPIEGNAEQNEFVNLLINEIKKLSNIDNTHEFINFFNSPFGKHFLRYSNVYVDVKLIQLLYTNFTTPLSNLESFNYYFNEYQTSFIERKDRKGNVIKYTLQCKLEKSNIISNDPYLNNLFEDVYIEIGAHEKNVESKNLQQNGKQISSRFEWILPSDFTLQNYLSFIRENNNLKYANWNSVIQKYNAAEHKNALKNEISKLLGSFEEKLSAIETENCY